MNRRFYTDTHSSKNEVHLLVTLNEKFFWRARIGNIRSNRLFFDEHEVGRITDTSSILLNFEETDEKKFWKTTGKHEAMIRWSLSAYSVHISRQMPQYLASLETETTEKKPAGENKTPEN